MKNGGSHLWFRMAKERMTARRRKGYSRLRRLAQDPEALREALGIHQPPVLACRVAEALGLTVVHASSAETGFLHALTFSVHNKPRILVAGHKPEAVLNFGVAHEIYEAVLPDECSGRERHMRANQLAAELLMPRHWVHLAVEELGYDVVALAEKFVVSCEAMALRLMQFYELGVTIMDNGRIIRRSASEGFTIPASLVSQEKEAIRILANGCEKAEVPGDHFSARAFRVPGNGPVIRFILLTIPFSV